MFVTGDILKFKESCNVCRWYHTREIIFLYMIETNPLNIQVRVKVKTKSGKWRYDTYALEYVEYDKVANRKIKIEKLGYIII